MTSLAIRSGMTRWILWALLVTPAASAHAQESAADVQAIVEMLERGDLSRAEGELRQILSRTDHPAARDMLGITLSRLGRQEEAEKEFRRAVALAPELLPPRQHLARLLLQEGRFDDAYVELKAAAELGALERRMALWLGEAELSRGNASKAAAQFGSVAERFGSVKALLELGRLQARSGDNQSAAATLDRALEIAPNSEEVLAARAKVALMLEHPVVAIIALEALARMHPDSAEHAYLLGVARLQVAEAGGAIETLERSLAIAPGRPLPLLALGKALAGQKKYPEAVDALRQSLQRDPENVETLVALAEAETGLDDLEPAETHVSQALARAPEHAGALMVLGRIRMKQARYEEARDAFLQAATSAPGQSRIHYQLSLAFARLGDRETSSEHLALYRQLHQEEDDRLVELRTRAGLTTSGMGSS